MSATARRLGRGGFMLLDAVIAYVILGFAMVSLVPLFVLSIRANKNSERVTVGSQLSQRLLEEIQMRKWDRLTPLAGGSVKNGSNSLGPDTADGEISSDKRTFDDIDDFAGWTESPPKDPMMLNLGQFAAYTSSASVFYVTSSLVFSGNRTNYKQITACTWAPKMKSICLSTLRTNR